MCLAKNFLKKENFQVASMSQTLGRLFFLSAYEDGLLNTQGLGSIEDEGLRNKLTSLLKQLDELKLDPTEHMLLRNVLILKGRVAGERLSQQISNFVSRKAPAHHPKHPIPPRPTPSNQLPSPTHAPLAMRLCGRFPAFNE
jgi:hypothetical protein